MRSDLQQLLFSHLRHGRSGFSVGGFGALAEFHDLCDDIEMSDDAQGITALSPRGAMRIELRGQETALAYEARSEHADAWQHGLSVIGELDRCAMSARARLTELGPDRNAISANEQDALLFDLGTGLPHVDFCVRTRDQTLITFLRRHLGEHVTAGSHSVMDAVIDASPQRVVVSYSARIEVYQRIDRHRTPSGPHTHLLPDLLSRRRTHSANIPIPRGAVPLLTLHPENPLLDEFGHRRPFKAGPFKEFTQLLARYGDPVYVAEKQRLLDAISGGETPDRFAPATSRVGRLAQRIALSQLAHTATSATELRRWRDRLLH